MDTESDSPQWCMVKEGQNPPDTTQEICLSKDRIYFTMQLVKHQQGSPENPSILREDQVIWMRYLTSCLNF